MWTPFARETLKDIARRTTARNGVSPKKARNFFLFVCGNIMQRLSSATGLSTQWWRKLFNCSCVPFSFNNYY